MKDRPSTMVILSYCDVITTLYVCRVCKRWLEDVKHYWKIVKRFVFFKHVHVVPGSILKNNNKLMWLARQCHNLRILDVRWCSVSVHTLIALIDRVRMLDNDMIRLDQKINTIIEIQKL